jgi:hypothetical protein
MQKSRRSKKMITQQLKVNKEIKKKSLFGEQSNNIQYVWGDNRFRRAPIFLWMIFIIEEELRRVFQRLK